MPSLPPRDETIRRGVRPYDARVRATPTDAVVLGVDPGTHVCGWGVVARRGGRLACEGYGVVVAPPRAPIERRLAAVADGLRDVVRRLAPTEAAVEEVFHGIDARAAIRLGEGRGAALVVLAAAGVAVSHYANNAVKRAVTGAGRADKERVRSMVRAILALPEIDARHDASDALALAICHHHVRGAIGGSLARGGGVPASRYAPRVAAAIEALRAAEHARARARSAP
jgi:crossover junction endodeoxyribonuclease RuvC